ncbi:MAG: T9SS type A sorting domain-containing protein [Chitinophagales bacterium]|nr:T9SS type A sorting domain-containing protein [Chitinophagales bacterium]
MKKVYFLLLVILASASCFSQCTPYPAFGEIYNYAIDDTFQYVTYINSAGSSFSGYEYQIIEARNNYGGDSIVYGIKSIQKTSLNNVTVSNQTQKIVKLDSAINTYNRQGAKWMLDTIFCGTDSGIVLFTTRWHVYDSVPCENFIVRGITDNIRTYSPGLGETKSSYATNTSPCNYYGQTNLIYAHKADGFIYGTPYDFPTAVNELERQKGSIKVYPNPAFETFQLQIFNVQFGDAYFELFDAVGRRVKYEKVSSSTSTFERANTSNGVYLWQLKVNDDILERGKLVFE